MDHRESLDEALAREVREECGFALADVRYFGSFANTYHYCDVHLLHRGRCFLCRPAARRGRERTLSEENSGYALPAPDAVDEASLAFDSVKAALRKYAQCAAGAVSGRSPETL